jgi:hypothetical protein
VGPILGGSLGGSLFEGRSRSYGTNASYSLDGGSWRPNDLFPQVVKTLQTRQGILSQLREMHVPSLFLRGGENTEEASWLFSGSRWMRVPSLHQTYPP